MVFRCLSFGIDGIDGFKVEVEASSTMGLPQIDIVGLPDAAVKESKNRVRSALKNSGITLPSSHITVNLAPADIKKEGSHYDLPLAVVLMQLIGNLKKNISDLAFIGELSLSGEIRRVNGVLPMVIKARELGIKKIFVPVENSGEAAVVDGIDVYCAKNLIELMNILNEDEVAEKQTSNSVKAGHGKELMPDFCQVKGQYEAKRALEIAAAGAHNFLLVGSPGAGKTLCAKCLPGILPEMTEQEILETTRIHSCARRAGDSDDFKPVLTRPFRSPHHSASMASLVGGGTRLLPGEASLAHNGVLFLDELPEFNRNVLEALREPMEEGEISVSRASGTVVWPARFMMGAAMNPCPCGYSMDPKRECTCLPEARKRYREKISGPLLDRIDIQVSVPPVDAAMFAIKGRGESSADIRKRVCAARTVQRNRFRNLPFKSNAEMSSEYARKFASMTPAVESFAVNAAAKMELSARGYFRLLKVARTIADLRGASAVDIMDLSEALRYRAFRG